MPTLAKDVVYLFEQGDVTLRKAFLIGNENVGVSGIDPAGEDPFEEDVGIEALFSAYPTCVKGDASAMAHGNLIARCGGGFVEEVDVAIQSDTIGAGDNIEMGLHAMRSQQSGVP